LIQVTDFDNFLLEHSQKTAITIGNFDGCHLGHQRLTKATLTLAAKFNCVPTAITFNPRPEAYFRNLGREALLFTEAQKTRCLGELGIEHQIVQTFDYEFSHVNHFDFFHKYLCNKMRMRALIVGDDFHFGFQRRGDAAFLKTESAVGGITLEIGEAVEHTNHRISSTRLRDTIHRQGDVEAAALMLGRPYMVEGIIEKGDQLGRRIGFPTANLGSIGQLLPRTGVYAGYTWLPPSHSLDRRKSPAISIRPNDAIPAVFNVGVRPTLGDADPSVRVEAHLLTGKYGPDDLYELQAAYYFVARLRDEHSFPGLPELKSQIDKDARQARAILGI
jgi:riboflavin kinase/FMN adenylyltransferase